MHILVTGAAGFIGTHVLAELLARGHEVRALDSLRPDVHRDGSPWQVVRGVEALIGDVRDRELVARAVKGVDAVIHLAAKVGLGVDIADMPDYASSNDVGTAELLVGMAEEGVSRLTLASSMVVYGEGFATCPEHGAVRPAPRRARDLAAGHFEPPCPHCGRPLASGLVGEDTPADPRNAYATSKLAQEFYAANWARATGGSVAMMRYHNVYGPGMPRDTPYAGVASIFTSALRRGEAPKVFEDGNQRRDFIHVGDIAAATVLACERHGEGVGAYNVGSGTPRTVGEMALALSRALGGPAPVVTGQYRLGDVRHITADSSRLRRELGWHPRVSFEKGMAEFAGLHPRTDAAPQAAGAGMKRAMTGGA
ncbi:NAD-dependent epimerase/dehydratase family protein [Ancylobacter sp. MQZ15Z-1]|uniref:NAD-dependent epimerase/dehydratase family protein n=1 Tax=Ancylobacter mangrovi TaxID=2972472 RepID=A0A9X2PFJ2_9HYPH|nr:NAD-dependent epimerase/dehydratase family protein [Ancylobacter mangrovi]MCS0496444.1 NAD-dependent epimerase/dehydratase family protein [Ancylobacter mangrovi]